ncbi:MAG TPA: hypothetical protein VIG73_14745 [Cerasibacillus sp.]|uniref:YphA family membrane protein n=1 Tax=Cerasibacillus sp. TaxID=2498711 RepID=UPI002F3FE865
MSSGLVFYWLSWIYFVCALFFMEPSKRQWFFMYWILILISTSNMFISIGMLDFSVAYFILFLGSLMFLLQANHRFFYFFVSFTIAIAYASFLVWEHETPLLLIFPKYVVLPSFIVLIAIFLTKEYMKRCFVALLGICGGELLYHISLFDYAYYNTMGNEVFLDLCTIIIGVLFVIALYEYIIDRLFMMFSRIKQR